MKNVKQLLNKNGGPARVRTWDQSVMSRPNTLKMLNKMPTGKLAEITQFSKSYISQIKGGYRPPSNKLLDILEKHITAVKSGNLAYLDTLSLFLESRREGISPNTLRDYKITLGKALKVLGLSPTTQAINDFLSKLDCSLGGKYGYYKCIRAFYNWLYSPRAELGFSPENNPILWVNAPKRPLLILPSLNRDQVELLINKTTNIRDKAIVALFTESGLRLIELAHVTLADIDWTAGTIKVLGKGKKEALAPFGGLSRHYLTQWLAQYQPNGNIWGLNKWGIVSMLKRLENATGLPCNPHTFRRTFACLLRKSGVDTMTIKDLGRWESLEMVQRYTRSFTFNDALKHYKPPLGNDLAL